MLQTGRHAAPRVRPALLLPAVLLLSGGAATAGAGLLPAAAGGAGASPARDLATARSPGRAPAVLAQEPLRLRLRGVREQQPVGGPVATATTRTGAAEVGARTSAAASRARRPAPAADTAPPPPAQPAAVRPGVGRLTSQFGPRWGRLHTGIDLAGGTGAPVSAVAAGVVLSAGAEGGYGNVVRVLHGHGTVSLYAHLSQVLVIAGDQVHAGALLGREGSTGASTGPHLHFEVRVGDVPVDPGAWLRERGLAL